MILVLDLRLRQRGAVMGAPVHGLQPFVDVALIEEINKRARNHGLIAGAHGEVWILPTPEHTQPDEILALQINVFLGVLSASGTDLGRCHGRLFRA